MKTEKVLMQLGLVLSSEGQDKWYGVYAIPELLGIDPNAIRSTSMARDAQIAMDMHDWLRRKVYQGGVAVSGPRDRWIAQAVKLVGEGPVLEFLLTLEE